MELSLTSSYRNIDEKRLLPTIETYSDALSDYFQKRHRAALFLLVLFASWSVVLLFFSNHSLFFITIPNCLFLLSMLIKADSFERKAHIQRKTIFNIAILKSLIETFVLAFMIFNAWKNMNLGNSNGVLLCVTGALDLLYFAVGIYIVKITKEIIQILDLDIYNKEMSSYFHIANL